MRYSQETFTRTPWVNFTVFLGQEQRQVVTTDKCYESLPLSVDSSRTRLKLCSSALCLQHTCVHMSYAHPFAAHPFIEIEAPRT